MTTKHRDPLISAPDREELPFRNVAKLVRNEITDMPLKLKEKSGISPATQVDFWQITFEACDAAFTDGTLLPIQFGTKLYDKAGEDLDKTQRPYTCAQAFAGLGIVIFPDSPSYTGEEIGEYFILEATKFATGKPAPLPIERLGKDYTYTGEVRVVQSRQEREAGSPTSVSAPSSISITELAGNEAAQAEVATALAGINLEDRGEVIRALRNIGVGKTLNGASLLGLAASGKAISELQAAGLIE